MELYGRPQVARRNSSHLTTVSFLNDAKTREGSTLFMPPSSARNPEKTGDANASLEITRGRTGGLAASPENSPITAASAATLYHHARSPPLSRPRQERPQSGGVRRPAPGSTVPSAMMTKPRPSTARESSRPAGCLSHWPPLMSDIEMLFTRRQDQNCPEINGVEEEEREEKHRSESGERPSLDEAYIRQLKADILFCHHALSREHSNFMSSSSSMARSHTHVKNVQNMREKSRLPNQAPAVHADAVLQSQLARYTFSSDPVQLRSAKARLEELLAQSLTQLMRQFLELREDKLDGDNETLTDEQHQQRVENDVRLVRPAGTHLPFANGCGSDTTSIYAGCVFGVLQRVEKFRTIIVGLQSEKTGMLKESQEKDRQMQRLSEQVELFKDALAKSVAKHSRSGARSQSQSRIPAPETAESPAFKEGDGASPEIGIEKELERSAQMNALEKERLQLEVTVKKMQSELDTLSEQLRDSRAEAETHARAASSARGQLDETVAKSARDLQARDQQTQELRGALNAMADRCRQLEEIDSREKQTLRKDKLALEKRIRNLEEEARAMMSESVRIGADLKRSKECINALTGQLEAMESKLADAVRACDATRAERDHERAVGLRLQQELHDATRKGQQSDALRSSQQQLLHQTELKLAQAHAEVHHQSEVIQQQANQLCLLEAKLSKSISVDENEQKQRQQEEETAWHQRVAALEHALAVERQTIHSLKEQHVASIAMERDQAAHCVAQAKTISLELEAANLCLAERKRQREKELQEFTDEKVQLLDRIAHLVEERDGANAALVHLQQQHASAQEALTSRTRTAELESKVLELQNQVANARAEVSANEMKASARLERLRAEFEAKERQLDETHRQSVEDEIGRLRCAAETAVAAELGVRQQLLVLTAERDGLLHKLQSERSTPRGSALSEARVELQRAKLKIMALEKEKQLTKNDSARGKDVEAKAAVLAAREKKLLDDQKLLKTLKQDLSAEKQLLRTDRDALETTRAQLEADALRNRDAQKLLRQIISLLARRLALQMELLGIIPQEVAAHSRQRGHRAASLADFLTTFRLDHSDQWRDMQLKWEQLQQELDDVDWQLVHMRNRLEELHLQAPQASPARAARPKQPMTSPFSDAIAAGKETVPVAEELLASASKAAMAATPSGFKRASKRTELKTEDQQECAARSRDEEPDTFAIALTKEMRAMKESYEKQLDDLQQEMRTTQKLRMESVQRLRAELDEEKKRSHQIIAQLTERCAALEAQLQALQRGFALAQDRQIELLVQYERATTEFARAQILRLLHAAVEEACSQERTRRATQERDRVRKLQDYCGSSSVTVEREDKKRLV